MTAILLSLEKEFEQCQRGLEELGCPDQVNDLKLLREAPRKTPKDPKFGPFVPNKRVFFLGAFLTYVAHQGGIKFLNILIKTNK